MSLTKTFDYSTTKLDGGGAQARNSFQRPNKTYAIDAMTGEVISLVDRFPNERPSPWQRFKDHMARVGATVGTIEIVPCNTYNNSAEQRRLGRAMVKAEQDIPHQAIQITPFYGGRRWAKRQPWFLRVEIPMRTI